MAHSGYQACFLYLNWWDFIKSNLLPELNGGSADQQLQALADLAARARWGIEIIALLNTPGLEKSHPVFAAHLEVCRATVMSNAKHCLCASSGTARAFYAEQAAHLFASAPQLGGIALLIGGEGFRHCYMRPNPRTEKVTNSPQCANGSAPEALTPLLHSIITGVRRCSDSAKVIFWPYSSDVWQNQPMQEYDWSVDRQIIKNINKGAVWITEMEKDGSVEIPNVGQVSIHDYSIQLIGPSPKASLIASACRDSQVGLGIKTETNISIELHSLPYIPVITRWLERAKAMRRMKGVVQWENWRLNGFWPSPSNEVFYWESRMGDDPSILSRIGERLYGRKALPDLFAAWDCFSKAWDVSHPRYGTYWSGPLFIGPAHPFDIGMAFLDPAYYSRDFYQIAPGRLESETDSSYFTDPRNQRPKFYLFPGRWPKERIRDYGILLGLWGEGIRHLESALLQAPAPLFAGARSDVDMAMVVGFCFEEDKAFHEFVLLRDQLHQSGVQSLEYSAALRSMESILKAAISRASECIPMMRRTPMIGAGPPVFGVRFTIPMIEEKMAKTTALLAKIRRSLESGESLLPA